MTLAEQLIEQVCGINEIRLGPAAVARQKGYPPETPHIEVSFDSERYLGLFQDALYQAGVDYNYKRVGPRMLTMLLTTRTRVPQMFSRQDKAAIFRAASDWKGDVSDFS